MAGWLGGSVAGWRGGCMPGWLGGGVAVWLDAWVAGGGVAGGGECVEVGAELALGC